MSFGGGSQTLTAGSLSAYGSRNSASRLQSNLTPSWLPESYKRLFLFAGIGARQVNILMLRSVATIVVAGVLATFLGSWKIILLIPIIFAVELYRLACRSHSRAESFERDYTALLLSLASSVRTGQDPFFALTEAHRLFSDKSEIHKQLLQFRDAVDSGFSEDSALAQFGADIDHPDITLFRTAFVLARRQGSSIAECLQRLARVTRQRQSFRRKIKGAVAMQKLSALGIAGCVVLVGIFQWCANPDALRQTMQHPLGQKLIFGGLSLVLIGVIWMMRMSRTKI